MELIAGGAHHESLPMEEVPSELRTLVARLREVIVDGTRLGGLGNPLLELPHPGLEPLHLEAVWWLRVEVFPSVNTLADRLGIPLPRTSRLVDDLEEQGLAERDRASRDRRFVRLRLTPAGRAAAAYADGHVQQRLARLLAPLEEDDRCALVALMERLVAAHARQGANTAVAST
ncbi:MarR family winged helix-turn-helix transcriptional regulator [Myxococcaceae bacterium GXIMD 01537]